MSLTLEDVKQAIRAAKEADNTEKLDEILQRAIRTETRLIKLGEHMGVALRYAPTITVYASHNKVVIDAYDVSISQILKEVSKFSFDAPFVEIHCKGVKVGTMNVSLPKEAP